MRRIAVGRGADRGRELGYTQPEGSFEYRSENALAIMDDAIAFKRARGLPSARLTGYEWQRWCEKHGAETW